MKMSVQTAGMSSMEIRIAAPNAVRSLRFEIIIKRSQPETGNGKIFNPHPAVRDRGVINYRDFILQICFKKSDETLKIIKPSLLY